MFKRILSVKSGPLNLRRRAAALLRLMRAQDGNPEAIARGLAIGAFFAFVPTFGQFAIAVFIAHALKGNRALAGAVTLLTNPLTTPPIMLASAWLGALLRGQTIGSEVRSLSANFAWSHLAEISGDFALSLLLGSLILSAVSSILAYSGARAWFYFRSKGPAQELEKSTDSA